MQPCRQRRLLCSCWSNHLKLELVHFSLRPVHTVSVVWSGPVWRGSARVRYRPTHYIVFFGSLLSAFERLFIFSIVSVRSCERRHCTLQFAPPPEGTMYCDVFICLFVCVIVLSSVRWHRPRPKSETTRRKFTRFFYACCQWPWLSRILTALRYVM